MYARSLAARAFLRSSFSHWSAPGLFAITAPLTGSYRFATTYGSSFGWATTGTRLTFTLIGRIPRTVPSSWRNTDVSENRRILIIRRFRCWNLFALIRERFYG